MLYDKKKILSAHQVPSQLGFCQTWANFGEPISNDQLLFAALTWLIHGLKGLIFLSYNMSLYDNKIILQVIFFFTCDHKGH